MAAEIDPVEAAWLRKRSVAGHVRPILSAMSVVSSYDCNEEPTEAEHAEALARFRAARGRYPGVSAELRRSRLAEIKADYPDVAPSQGRQRQHERVDIEL